MDGAVLQAGAALSCMHSFADALQSVQSDRPGIRLQSVAGLADLLDPAGPIGQCVVPYAGRPMFPVRALLFDKSATTNWALGWHQDRTIAVRARTDVPGFGPWTIKGGIQHVEPPFAIINAMLTVRIHLDPVPADNAPLLVALGSHKLGRIPEASIQAVVDRSSVHACLAAAGDVWIYATAILHASHAAARPARRRVLQVDYAAAELPGALAWAGL